MHNTQPDQQPNPGETALVVPPGDVEISPPTPKQESRILTAIRKPGEYLSGALNSIKGRDLEALVEEFTTDVSLVLGGLSDDQERLGHECDRLAKENERLGMQLGALEKRVKELEKKAAARPERDGLIHRLTWLAAIVFGGMALLYVLKFLLD